MEVQEIQEIEEPKQLSFTFVSDTHNQAHKLKLKGGDFLIHTGDFTTRGRENEAVDFLHWFDMQSLKYKHTIFVAGNHDKICMEYWWREYVNKYAPTATYLQFDKIELEGISFFGTPSVPHLVNGAFYKDEEALNRERENIPKVDVLLSHAPPYKILDYAPLKDKYFGDPSFSKLKFVPKIHAFGHIHESHNLKQDTPEGTLYVNSSILDDTYTIAYKPYDLKVQIKDDKLFWEEVN
jgi:Icc-related predicted phosphoesterase